MRRLLYSLTRSAMAPQRGQLFFQPLEAAVEVVDADDRGLAFGGKPSDHQQKPKREDRSP